MDELIFAEDDALQHDPTYRGVHEWWEKSFPGRDFDFDWDDAKPTEVDHGDSFQRSVSIGERRYLIHQSFDGYSVYRVSQ